MMNVSKDFTLEELIRTSTGLPNNPAHDEVARLTDLAASILQPIRDRWGRIGISSGFRSYAVNSAVGGVSTSRHCFGEAADFIPLDVSLDEVYRWIVNESNLNFGQCINESRGGRRWIHISLPGEGGRNQEALVYDGKSYTRFAG